MAVLLSRLCERSLVPSNLMLPCDLFCTSWSEASDPSQVSRDPPCLGSEVAESACWPLCGSQRLGRHRSAGPSLPHLALLRAVVSSCMTELCVCTCCKADLGVHVQARTDSQLPMCLVDLLGFTRGQTSRLAIFLNICSCKSLFSFFLDRVWRIP